MSSAYQKGRSSKRLASGDFLGNTNGLYIGDGKQEPSKEKAKTDGLDRKQKGVREATETKVLILRRKALNDLVKGLSYPPQRTLFSG